VVCLVETAAVQAEKAPDKLPYGRVGEIIW